MTKQELVEDLFLNATNGKYVQRLAPTIEENKHYPLMNAKLQKEYLNNLLSNSEINVNEAFIGCALCGKDYEIDIFLKNGLNPNYVGKKSKEGYSGVFAAVANRYFEPIRKLINKTSNLNLICENKNLVVTAIDKEHIDTAYHLVFNRKADLMVDKEQLNCLIFQLKNDGGFSRSNKWINLVKGKGREIILEYAKKGYDFNKTIYPLNQSFLEAMQYFIDNKFSQGYFNCSTNEVVSLIEDIKIIQSKLEFEQDFSPSTKKNRLKM